MLRAFALEATPPGRSMRDTWPVVRSPDRMPNISAKLLDLNSSAGMWCLRSPEVRDTESDILPERNFGCPRITLPKLNAEQGWYEPPLRRLDSAGEVEGHRPQCLMHPKIMKR